MRPRELRLLLEDVQNAIRQIEEFTCGLTLAEYERSELIQRGVERNFEIIGEAITRTRRVSKEVTIRIDYAVKISGFRNVLAHEYEIVDPKRVWLVAMESLPKLKRQIDAWAAELGMEPLPEQA